MRSPFRWFRCRCCFVVAMASSLPGAAPKSLTSHYGAKWNSDGPRGNTRAAAPSNPSPPLPLPPPSFANEPNPSSVSSWRILPLFEQKLAAAGALALATTFALWKFYRWWRRDGGDDSAKKPRDRIRDKFDVQARTKTKSNSPHKGHSRGSRATPSPPPQHNAQTSSGPSPHPSRAPSSSPSAETGSDRYRAFMSEVRVLAEHGVIITAPLDFYLKRERMRESNLRAIRVSEGQGRGSQGSLHVLTSFDRSCTTLKQAAAVSEDGSAIDPAAVPNCLTTQSMLDASLPATYSEASRKLFSQYYPLESNTHISAAQREECMREWWTKAHALLSLDEFRLTRNKIAAMVNSTLDQGRIRLRPGIVELLEPVHGLCGRFDIPVFVMSGSIHDLIEELLLAYGVRVANTNRGDLGEVEAALCARSPVHLIANPLRWGVSKHVGSIVDRVAQGSPSMSPLSRLHSLSASAAASALCSAPLAASSSSVSLIPGPHAPAAVCLGFDQRFLIHSLNKTYARVLEQPNLARAVTAKCNLILMGNTVADAGMALGAELRAEVIPPIFEADACAAAESKEEREFALDDSYVFTAPTSSHAAAASVPPSPALPAVSSFDVMRIGFLNDVAPTAQRLEEFKAVYDVVLLGDQSCAFVGHTIAFLCGADEAQVTAQ